MSSAALPRQRAYRLPIEPDSIPQSPEFRLKVQKVDFPCNRARPDLKPLTTEHELRAKLRKIAALFEGAATAGERDAAAAALSRIRAALDAAEKVERPVEMNFRLPDRWGRRLFLALCRRYGLRPYRYPRQRYSTVVVRAPESFINRTLWPEYLEISRALDEYLNEATERIIREEVFGDADEAEERPEASPKQAATGGLSLGSES